MNLRDKVAIVTGGARGIGRAISKSLAEDGARVTIINQSPNTAKQALKFFEDLGLNVKNRLANVSSRDEVDSMVKAVIDEFGKIDILVNNAGITRDNLMVRMKDDEWDDVINVNLKGTFNCMKAVSRPMMKARCGRIINISSIVGITGNAGQVNYCASKAGIIGMTKTVARELASRSITVNAVAPGFIETEMTEGLQSQAKESFLENIPLGRPGTPDDVAKVVCFLASDAAAYITGQTVNVDGGMVM